MLAGGKIPFRLTFTSMRIRWRNNGAEYSTYAANGIEKTVFNRIKRLFRKLAVSSIQNGLDDVRSKTHKPSGKGKNATVIILYSALI